MAYRRSRHRRMSRKAGRASRKGGLKRGRRATRKGGLKRGGLSRRVKRGGGMRVSGGGVLVGGGRAPRTVTGVPLAENGNCAAQALQKLET